VSVHPASGCSMRRGYDIVPKGEPPPADAEWAEGAKTLVSHLKGERNSGLAQAKRADSRAKHGGRNFCERCLLDPVTHFETEHGEARRPPTTDSNRCFSGAACAETSETSRSALSRNGAPSRELRCSGLQLLTQRAAACAIG
jgi:hypothetical protein